MIGKEIRRRRKEQGLTIEQLAAKAGMAFSAVSQIETGKRTPHSTSVVKLAYALGVDVGDLYPKGQAPLVASARALLEMGREEFGAYLDDLDEQRERQELERLAHEISEEADRLIAEASRLKASFAGEHADIYQRADHARTLSLMANLKLAAIARREDAERKARLEALTA